jgi:hypothetical protein
MDQVLCDLQDPLVGKGFSAWEKDFLPSISMQYANWRLSSSKMSFGTARQRGALLEMYRRHYPENYKNIGNFSPFDEEPESDFPF